MSEMEEKTTGFNKLAGNILGKVAGVMTFILLFVYPLYIKNRYGEVVEGKYYLYWKTVLGGLAVVFVLGLIFLIIDKIKYNGENTKAFSAKFLPGRWKKTFTIYDGFLIAFMASSVISALQSEYFYESVWGNEGRYSGTFLLLVYGISVFLIGKLLRFHQWYLEAFLVSAMVVCFLGITDYFHWDIMGFELGMIRNQGIFTSTFGNINVYTAFVDIVMGVSATLFASSKGKTKFWYYICTVVSFIAAITGRSDNVYLAFGVLFAFLPFYVFNTRRGIGRYVVILASFFTITKILAVLDIRQGKELGMVIGLDGLAKAIGHFSGTIVLIAALWALAAIIYATSKEKIDEILGKEVKYCWVVIILTAAIAVLADVWYANTGEHGEQYGELAKFFVFNDSWGTDRGYAWRFAMELYNQFPIGHKIFGYGADTFGILTTRYSGATAAKMYEDLGVIYDNAHNAYLQYLVTIGAAGLASYVLFLVSSVFWMIKRGTGSPAVMACVFGALCYCFQSVVNIELPGVTPAFWTILAVGLAAARREIRDKGEKTSQF